MFYIGLKYLKKYPLALKFILVAWIMQKTLILVQDTLSTFFVAFAILSFL